MKNFHHKNSLPNRQLRKYPDIDKTALVHSLPNRQLKESLIIEAQDVKEIHCRTGSLENPKFYYRSYLDIHCRTGSLEKFAKRSVYLKLKLLPHNQQVIPSSASINILHPSHLPSGSGEITYSIQGENSFFSEVYFLLLLLL